jgi:hypothetical protein
MNQFDSKAGKERRRHPRFPIDKNLVAETEDGRFSGRLKDISATGAGVYLDESPDGALDAGDDVSLDIDDLGTFEGHVAGPTRFDLIPVTFDNDEEEQDELIAEIMKFHSGMALDD